MGPCRPKLSQQAISNDRIGAVVGFVLTSVSKYCDGHHFLKGGSIANCRLETFGNSSCMSRSWIVTLHKV